MRYICKSIKAEYVVTKLQLPRHLGKKLRVINLNQQSDSADLLGGLVFCNLYFFYS